jgi:UDP-glucose 4-epimerase
VKKSRILVTGGAGFLGSHLTSELLNRGHAVQVIDDLSGGFLDNVDTRAQFVEGSVTDENLVQRTFADGKFDFVFHLAAYAAEGLSHFIKKFNYKNNLIGSVNLINASINHGIKCFVFTSSIAVYGRNQVPMTEEMVPLPEDPYGIAKLAVEQELRVSQATFGLDYVIFRPHNVYGERQNIGDPYRNVVGIFMNQIMLGQPMTIFGDGEQTRAFTYVGDIIRVMADAPFDSRARNHIFNVGADNPYTIKELADKVASAMGVSPNVKHLEPRNEVKHAFASHKKLRDLFGYETRVSLETGIEKMAAWACSVGARRSKRFGRVEVAKNMPEFWKNESHSRSEQGKDRVSIRTPRGLCEIRRFDKFKS